MKVCLITLRPEFKLGGQTESIINLALKLLKKNVAVELEDPLQSNLMECDRFREHHTGGEVSIKKIFYVFSLIFRVIINARKFDILQLHLPTPAFSMIADFIKIMTFKKIIVVYESHLIPLRFSEFKKNIGESLRFYFIRYMINNRIVSLITLRLCDGYVVSTEFQKRELKVLNYNQSKIHIIANCTDIEKYSNPTNSTEFDSLPIKNNLLLYIGHFWDTKGVMDLLEAFTIVEKKNNNINLVLAWSGLGDFNKISRYIQNHNLENKIILLGQIKVQNLLTRAKLLILPYKYSFGTVMFPNLILEAFAAGTPVLSTDLPAIKEIINHKQTGFIAEHKNPVDIAKKIIEIINTPTELINQIIINQKQKLNTIYNPANIADTFIEIYKGLIKSGN